MSDTGSPTFYFNLHWTNDQGLYLAVLDHGRTLLRRVPGMTDQTLGRNIRDAVQLWCADGQAGVSSAVLRMMADEVKDFGAVSETEVGEEVRELLGEEFGELLEEDPSDDPEVAHNADGDEACACGCGEAQTYPAGVIRRAAAQQIADPLAGVDLARHAKDCDLIVYRDGVHTCDCGARQRGVELELLNMPGETMRFAMVEHDGDLFVICSEGVGWTVTEAKPLVISSTPLSPDQVRERVSGETIDLADFIRSFGARLESNFWSWHRTLTKVAQTPVSWVDRHRSYDHEASVTSIAAPGWGQGSYCYTCKTHGPTTGGILTEDDVR